MRAEYTALRNAYEFRRDHAQARYALETIVGQHAIIMIDMIRRNGPQTGARLEENRAKWEFAVFFALGQENVVTRQHDPLQLEHKFQQTVNTMLRTFTDGIVGAVMRAEPFDANPCADFYAVLSTRAVYVASQVCEKIQIYLYYLIQLSRTERDTDAFYSLAISCIVAATNLGLYLDYIL
jgi:hypothetical protein